jgi:hypothetical protein
MTEQNQNETALFILGRVIARMEKAGALRAGTLERAMQSPNQVIVQGVNALAIRGKMDAIEDLMGQLDIKTIPTSLPVVKQGEVSLGYYHERASRGSRPVEFPARLEVRLSTEMHAWLKEHGGAETIRRLVQAEMDRE